MFILIRFSSLSFSMKEARFALVPTWVVLQRESSALSAAFAHVCCSRYFAANKRCYIGR